MFVLDIDESSSHFIHLRFPLKATQPQAAKPNHLSLFFIFTTGNPSNPHANLQDFLCSLVPVGLAWLRSLHLIMERKLKRKHRHSTIIIASSSSSLSSLIPTSTEVSRLCLPPLHVLRWMNDESFLKIPIEFQMACYTTHKN